MNKKTVKDIDLKGKKVLVRCDFNVPMDENQNIRDNKRIVAALPTIQYLLDNDCAIILCSHLGRPKGEFKAEYSLKPVAKELEKLLEKEIIMAKDVIGEDAKAKAEVLQKGQILLLENVDVDIMASTVSVTAENLSLLQQLGFINANIVEYLGYGYVAINHNEPIMQDLNVRKALAYGLDRSSVVEAAFGGQANVIDIPQSTVSWAYPEEGDYTHYEYNPEKAKQLLEEAGWKVGSDGIREKDGVKLSLKFLASSPNPVNDVLVPVMIDNYKAIGVELKAEQMEFRTLVDKQSEAKEGKFSYHLAFLAWSLDIDPDSTSTFASNGANNKVGYSNPTVDKLLNDALNEMDTTKRKELYAQLYKEISEDLPYLFLYQRKDMNVYSSKVKGMEGGTPYRSFKDELEKISFE